MAYGAGDFEEAIKRVRVARLTVAGADWLHGYHDTMRGRFWGGVYAVTGT